MKLANIKNVYKSYFVGVAIAILYIYLAQFFLSFFGTILTMILGDSTPALIIPYVLYVCLGFYLLFLLMRRNPHVALGFLVSCFIPFYIFALFIIELAVHPPSEE